MQHSEKGSLGTQAPAFAALYMPGATPVNLIRAFIVNEALVDGHGLHARRKGPPPNRSAVMSPSIIACLLPGPAAIARATARHAAASLVSGGSESAAYVGVIRPLCWRPSLKSARRPYREVSG